jgi:hypothetical protein
MIQHTGPEPRTNTVTGVDGQEMTRAWCDTCGSGLWIRNSSKDPNGMFLKAGECVFPIRNMYSMYYPLGIELIRTKKGGLFEAKGERT